MAEGQSFGKKLKGDPAVTGLLENLTGFLTTKAQSVADKAMDKGSEEGGPIDTAKKEGKKGAIKGAIGGFFKGIVGKFKGKGGKRPVHIYESIFVGVPVDVAWDAWQEYEGFPNFMKGPEKVSRDEDGNAVHWTAKIFINRRSWTGEIQEEIENERLKWKTTEAKKGSIDGVITFTPLGDNLTHMLVVLEYRSKGFFEWFGKSWRTVGRRTRLDLKHFARDTTMAGYEQQGDEASDDGAREQPEAGPGDGPEPGAESEVGTDEEAGPGDEGTGRSEGAEGTERRPRREGRREQREAQPTES